MRWFKHYSDNHRGQSMQLLLDRHGHMGVACYYILMEMCAEKIERGPISEPLLFRFHEKLLTNALRVNRRSFRPLLETYAELNLLRAKTIGQLIEIEFPILLKLLDRDIKNARTVRVPHAPRPLLDKDKDKDKNTKKEFFDFEIVYKNYPRKEGKTIGMRKLKAEIKTQKDLENFTLAVEKYKNHCAKNKLESKYIKQFSSFVTSWKDWLEPDAGAVDSIFSKQKTNIYEMVKDL